MNTSKELQERVNALFKNNKALRDKLLAGDAEAIREIGSISQNGINPEDVAAAYESNDSETMKYLYRKSQKLIELQRLYKDLCLDYYKRKNGDEEIIL